MAIVMEKAKEVFMLEQGITFFTGKFIRTPRKYAFFVHV